MKKARIGLLWHSLTSDNLGVGALTVSNIAIIREICAELGVTPEFVILGWPDRPEPYSREPDVSIRSLRFRDFFRLKGGFFAEARRCDLVVDIGAGDSFADIYGTKRILTQLISKGLVLLARRPLALAPQTLGPFAKAHWRRLSLAVMRRAAMVATRDDLSTAFVRDIGYKGEVIEASDVALLLPFDPAPRESGGPVKVGLNVSGLLFNGGYSGDNMFGLTLDYAGLIRRIVEHFTGMEGVELHLVGHVISKDQPIEDDYRVCAKLAEEYPGAVLAPEFGSPSAAKSYISSMDFFMGARMHACIAAFSSGVPVTPMAYSRKFAGLFGTLGYDVTADCKSQSADEVMEVIRTCFENREEVRRQALEAGERGRARLATYRAAISGLLRNAKG